MKLKRLLSIAVLGTILAAALAATGCGGDDKAEGNAPRTTDIEATVANRRAFREVLRDLQNAAASGEVHHAARQRKSLDPVETAVVKELCNFAYQILVNHEERRLGNPAYIAERITRYAAFSRDEEADSVPVNAAVDELQKVIDLGSLTAKSLARYEKACYKHPPGFN